MLDNLVKLSNKYGVNPDFVLAGGGNTSYKSKSAGLIFVKASGVSLADIKEDGFVALERDKLAIMRGKQYCGDYSDAELEAAVLSDLMDARSQSGEGQGSKRPSVETLLHDLFPQAYVLHLHPALANGITCAKNGESAARELFGDDFVWVPSIKPGYTLSVWCNEAISAYKTKYKKDCEILILQNHGIFWAHDDLDTLDNMVSETMGKIESKLVRKPDFSARGFEKSNIAEFMPGLRRVYADKIESEFACAKFLFNHEIESLVKDRTHFAPVVKPFSPDHIVYYKAEPLFIDAAASSLSDCFDAFIAEHKYVPKIVAVQGIGCFALGKTKKECDTAAALFLDAVKIAAYTESFGGYLPLSRELTDFIINWEVESYRQKIALDGGSAKRLDEKICIVTGSAQGFGKGIAELMMEEGANVVIADINYDGAKALADELNSRTGACKAVALNTDITSEESIKAMVYDTVLEFGGIDIFVNNAGIVRAGGLDELSLRDFELVTSVNYTAYFLCVKYVSQIMKIQHEHNPSAYFDIIEINSKSGLAGSNKNFAYAGSKFGGIGLT